MAAPTKSSAAFFEAVIARRTIYAITNESPISDESIKDIVNQSFTHAPSAFNTQSSRGVVLLGKEHEKLWDLALASVRAVVPAERLPLFEGRVKQFRGGYGTVLFYDDPTTFQATEARIGPGMWAAIKDQMPIWTEHASGMAQYVAWTALELEGFGCSLQHYSGFLEGKVQTEWKVPIDWTLKSQLVFGKAVGGPDRVKTFMPIEERVHYHSS